MKLKIFESRIRQIRKSAAVTEDLRRRAQRVLDAAGDGYGMQESPSANRARFTVFPKEPQAFADNARTNKLVRSLDAGR